MTANKIKYFLFLIISSLVLGGCLGTQHLRQGEKLLYRQQIEIPEEGGVEAPKDLEKEDLRDLYAQNANRKLFLFAPIHYLVWFYYLGERHYDREKFIRKKQKVEKKFNRKIAGVAEEKSRRIANLEFKKTKKISKLNDKIENGNMFMQWGEPLAVLDTYNINLTVVRFHDYLASHGYFRNNVDFKVKLQDNRATVTYVLNLGPAYFLDTVFYDINDTAIYALLHRNIEKSYLQEGDRYDQNNFTKERERVDILLKDHGYYEFSRQYVEFDVDTAYRQSQHVAVGIIINEPAEEGYHKKYKIDEVHFVTDAGTPSGGDTRRERKYHNIHYSYYQNVYNLRILSQRVFIQPGDWYSRSNTFNTQRQLANLDAFKFVNVNYDTADGKFIARLYTSPLDRYQWSNEAGVNVTQGFPGPFYNMTFKKRNVFRGFETLDISGRFGFEGVASATSEENIYKSTEAGVNVTMTFPQLVWPMHERTRFLLGKYNPKTKLLTGYSYTERPEYRRTVLTFSGTYTMDSKRATQYSLTFANINIIDTVNTSASFREFLDEQYTAGNYSLVNSFYPSFVNSLIFGVTWNPNDYGSSERNSIFIRALAESGGTIWNFFEPKFLEDEGLQYFKYLRFSLDIRRNRILDKNTVLAYRFNSGVAYSYGANQSIPYEKFFFAGGSNSIRAWRPRRLGPGSFKPDLSDDPKADGLFDYSIEKPAEILLEASVELRKKLFGFVEGAVFVDAGNVWSFTQWVKQVDDEVIANGNAQFAWNKFYREIAMGTGFGLRFDFTFLILRFDIGMKVYDPARDSGDRFVLNRIRFWKPYGTDREPVIYNVGIGYPF